MAYITKIEIKNFKGINNLSLDICARNNCPVITLVGLNESGKTTILEALSHFVTSEGTISGTSRGAGSENPSTLVPISKKAQFSGQITIAAEVEIENEDKEAMITIFQRSKYEVDHSRLENRFKIFRIFEFADGEFVESSNIWKLKFYVKRKSAKHFRLYKRPNRQELQDGKIDLWHACIDTLRKSLPSVAYFPTFLVDVPDPIYLSCREGEHPKQKYYRKVLQDVLDSNDTDIDIEKHVVTRISDFRENHSNESTWYSALMKSEQKDKISLVFHQISNIISREIIGSWQRVFNRDVAALKVEMEWDVDLDRGNIPYVQFYISDGFARYPLRERSLGFRWFFLFLLFTQFKRDENMPTWFLFDEPAANLHPRAQKQLLQSLVKIIENKNRVIYSTHSAHMVNPKWLPAIYIVENKAINYESDDSLHVPHDPPTSISAKSFREFVGTSPDRISYFQPILDSLEYVPPALCPEDRVILTEGISDFRVFHFYCKEILEQHRVSILPGLGADTHDVQISGLIGKGIKFIVILDDDVTGKNAVGRYQDRWMLNSMNVATVGDLDKNATGKNLEKLLSDETIKSISNHYNTTKRISKKMIGLYYTEANYGLIQPYQSEETRKLIQSIVTNAIKRLLEQN